MTDIDEQVAALRDELDGAAVVDLHLIGEHVQALTEAMRTAPTHELAASAIREFHDAHYDRPDYAQAVIAGALSSLSLQILLAEPIRSLDGPDGFLMRLKRIAYAARAVGYTAPNTEEGGRDV